MYWKHFIISFVLTFSVLVAFFFYLNSTINRDDRDFQSEYPLIDAQEILQRHSHEDFMVIVISSTCPGRGYFMPTVVKTTDSLKLNGTPYYIVNDDCIGLMSDRNLTSACEKYELFETVYFLNPATYPINGGFFHVKRRYMDFVDDLCGTTENFPFGYALYLSFKNGQFEGRYIQEYGNNGIRPLRQ